MASVIRCPKVMIKNVRLAFTGLMSDTDKLVVKK